MRNTTYQVLRNTAAITKVFSLHKLNSSYVLLLRYYFIKNMVVFPKHHV